MLERGVGTGRCEAAAPAGQAAWSGMSTAVPGVEETPNPVVSSCVWNAVTPSGSGLLAGKPTVRRA
jgi:hypothetical protein